MSTNFVIPTKTSAAMVYSNWRIIKQVLDKWRYSSHEYREYGLVKSDMYRDGHADVREAVRRLPDDVYTGRMHRCHRAIQLSRNKIQLPEAMWTKQDDPLHDYLEPYLQGVYKENKEREEWNKK